MHALNRKQKRTHLSLTRRRKWHLLVPLIGAERTLKVAQSVMAMTPAARKGIGRTRFSAALTSYFDSKRVAQ
jgi:hypothetical protein